MKNLKNTVLCITALLFVGCFNTKLEGTYVGEEGAFLDKINFTSNSTVELTFFGSTTETTYTTEHNKVKINNAGEIQVLTITDNGCLDGGGFIGKYCKP
ncbi:hypothetical protein [Hwangdonia lutea]|uniref:Lipoprotein n=1 Tax=Hwangdonia lutea TaxID=3075823 RepID=A0AA97ELI7_9FLAO|nr:hypothetical protein [Hwangdonia sp. SCSIO 19198]WOD43704.1 hypothetical protein RNZ46_00210 [Hwangdonia sp. SCSIO 19198]